MNALLSARAGAHAAVLLLLGLTAQSCFARTAPTTATSAPVVRGPVYDGIVTVEPSQGTISAKWTIQLVRPADGSDSVTFLLNEALRLVEVAGPAVATYRDTVGGGLRRVTVRLIDRQGIATIRLAYEGRPRFSADSINGIGPEWVELALDSFWLPVVSDFAHDITGSVRISLPEGWEVVTSGEVSRAGADHVIRQTIPLVDVPWSASPRFRRSDGRRSDVVYVGLPDSTMQRVSNAAEGCAQYFDSRYGAPTPLPALRVVVAPRTGPGYARSNYIVITNAVNMSPRALSRFVCHEVAHFWANGAAASGPDNWLNEGFAEFVSNRAVRSLLGTGSSDSTIAEWRANAEGQPAIWTGPTGRRPGPRVSYSKAPLLLHRLEERIGAERMDAFLGRFMVEPIRTTPGVIDLLAAVAGQDAAAWFAAELGK